MRNWVLALFFALAASRAALAFASTDTTPLVRVRLQKSLQQFETRGLQLHVRSEGETLDLGHGGGLMETRHLQVRRQGGFFQVGQMDIGGKVLEIEADGVDGAARLRLVAQTDDTFDVIGVLDLETYITGVVASEMPISWPLEALKAQAVASRSYALAVMAERADYPFDLESTVRHQVFDLAKWRGLRARLRMKVETAIRQTAGQKLLWADTGKIMKAYYHSDCGGATEEPENVWGDTYKMGTVKDSGCALSRASAWTLRLSTENLRELLRKTFPDLGDDFEVMGEAPSASGRWTKIALRNTDGQQWTLNSNRFRELLGYGRLKSTLFQIQKSEAGFTFKGRGFGHGVGLCQMGSRLMALGGATYLQILKRYFPASRVQMSVAPQVAKLETPTTL